MRILCPQCNFPLVVTNRVIIGTPGRCPRCMTTFVLQDSADDEGPPAVPGDAFAAAASVPDQESADSAEQRVDAGRIYITMEQLQEWHNDREHARFVRWMEGRTTINTADGAGYFLDDYDEWLRLGMPGAR